MFSLLDLLTLTLTLSAASGSAAVHKNGEAETLQNFGVLIYPALEPQDVIGPVDPLQIAARRRKMDLALIAETMEPASVGPIDPANNPFNSSFWPVLVPTHTFATAPDLDVLIVPGGGGVRNMTLTQPHVDYIRAVYPNLKYLITICTGASLGARSGVMDGKRATTNKSAWTFVTGPHTSVKWVAPARWMVDGNVWSSSGITKCSHTDSGVQVTAGFDLIHAFIREKFGEEEEDRIAVLTEYTALSDPCDDPWAVRLNVSTVEKC